MGDITERGERQRERQNDDGGEGERRERDGERGGGVGERDSERIGEERGRVQDWKERKSRMGLSSVPPLAPLRRLTLQANLPVNASVPGSARPV